MKNPLPRFVFVGLLALMAPMVGCNGSIDATIDIHATLNATTTVDVNHVAQGSTVPITVQVTNVYLVEPSATPPAEHVSDAGHIVVYLDDDESAPLLTTAQTTFNVMIAASVSTGEHHLHCRVHKHDGTPTSTTFEFTIQVQASTTTTTGGDAGT